MYVAIQNILKAVATVCNIQYEVRYNYSVISIAKSRDILGRRRVYLCMRTLIIPIRLPRLPMCIR